MTTIPPHIIDRVRNSSPAMREIGRMVPACYLFITGFRDVNGVNTARIERINNRECDDLLISASEKGNLCIVKDLLDAGVDKNVRDEDNWTSLHWAVWENHDNVVELLLEAGIDKDVNTNFGTALHIAAGNGNYKIVEKLLDAGVDFNLTTNDCTALDDAIKNGHPKIAKLLLDKGVECNYWKPMKTVKKVSRCNNSNRKKQILLNSQLDFKYYNSPLVSYFRTIYIKHDKWLHNHEKRIQKRKEKQLRKNQPKLNWRR